jgi:hypothetical protein
MAMDRCHCRADPALQQALENFAGCPLPLIAPKIKESSELLGRVLSTVYYSELDGLDFFNALPGNRLRDSVGPPELIVAITPPPESSICAWGTHRMIQIYGRRPIAGIVPKTNCTVDFL